ncbi:hypothetical protein ES332_A10G094500v1 [Gossypium tomentosum]|uniref:Thioesterase domain-containing protein n=1 Tax=Gossypium tomentosum TaxID=34277 RepID=A0A5D2NMV8_GOSTO|nr:hypothetical protein ES332_A10G094500v1 [Gossypium tomentosum]
MMADTSNEDDQSMAMMHLQLQRSLKWLDDVTKGIIGYELESRSLAGLQVIEARTGFLRCNFIVPLLASDEVEIEAKVKGNKGKLTSIAVEVRNKSNGGRLIASAAQWTAANDYRSPQPQSQAKL